MGDELESAAGKIKQLERCINDLIAVLALPAIWTGGESCQLLATLNDSLLEMLQLDLVYSHMTDPIGEPPVQTVRFAPTWQAVLEPQEVGEILRQLLGSNPQEWPVQMRRPFRGQEISLVPLTLGLHGEGGMLVAGARRTDFPQKTERLILSVAANQAAIGLQEARLLGDQKRIARELDRRVAQRTADLAAVNEELKEKIAERRRKEEELRLNEQALRQAHGQIARSEADLLEAQRLTHACSWRHDLASGRVFVSPEALRMFGINSDEDTSDATCWFGKIHPEDRSHTQSLLEKCESEKSPYEADYRVVLPDGSIRYQHSVGRPVLNGSGELVEFIGTAIDVTEQVQARAALQKAFDEIEKSEAKLRQVIDAIPALAWCNLPDGPNEFLNKRWHEYTGLSADESHGWGWQVAFHPADLPPLMERWRKLLITGEPGEIEARLRRRDGVYRWFLIRVEPFRDEAGKIVRWYGTSTDIDDRKLAEEQLRRSEEFLAEGQRLSRTGSFSWCVATNEITWSDQLYRIFEFDERLPVTLDVVRTRVYPDDLPLFQDMIERAQNAASDFEYEHRVLMPDRFVKHIHLFAHATRDKYGRLEYVGAAQDVTDFHAITDAIANPVVVLTPDGTMLYANRVALNQLGSAPSKAKNEGLLTRAHPDDIGRAREECRAGLAVGIPFDLEMRLLKNEEYRWQLVQYNPLKDECGKVIRWYATATDIDDRKRAEEKLRQSEAELRTITDTIRQSMWVLAPDGTILYANRVLREITGHTIHEVVADKNFLTRVYHPDDLDRVLAERREGLLRGAPFELESRVLMKSGQYVWRLLQYNPLRDERGEIIRWYATATDIDDRKRTEERLRNENLVLREEIDRSSMFEEIVGSSRPMREVLKQVEKVAASDSTVLILGETGTGKELIARALHRRSKRATRAFVRVNCAAIPQSLIASELFGHEKGAFTGALQRRVGRFEAADGGTLFLDEIGDLPAETQITLLRVLQEREFERVGGNHPILVDVRVIAATNRDLPAAVAAGTFRQDLFYRLNVFPISVPPLRQRTEDIPLLVEYFVGRFAKGAGKDIRHITRNTLEQLKGYQWPGNIRELQNVVERAVILSETDTFAVDESWLKCEASDCSSHEGLSELVDREVKMIETALADSHGRISGPLGAAAKLGIPRQTLESKIRRLGIDRYGQKRPIPK